MAGLFDLELNDTCNVDEESEDDAIEVYGHNLNKNIKEAKLLQHGKILDDLIDDAILEICFESHRIAKLCTDEMNHKKTKSIFCFLCKSSKGWDKYSAHLCDCLNKQEGREDLGRKAKVKANYNLEAEFAKNCGDSDEDGNKRVKKGSRKKCKPQGNSLLKASYSDSPKYEHMSFDEKKTFLAQKCGVVSKKSKKPCTKTINCTTHTQDQRDMVRFKLGIKNDRTDCVDVDTIDEENMLPSFHAGDGSMSILSPYFGSSAFP